MKLTHYGHACLLVETDAGARLLIDPGTLSSGFEHLTGLTAVLVTHEHPDHLDVDRLGPLLAANPDTPLYAEPATAAQLGELGAKAVLTGDRLEFEGAVVEVVGGAHENVYDGFPGSGNVGYVIDGGDFYHPGDSFTVPDAGIDVLGLPICAPWLKLADSIAFLREIAPRVAVPMHEADLVDTSTAYFMVGHFTPEATSFSPLDPGIATTL